MASVEQACEANQPRQLVAECDNQENKDPGDSGEVSLRKMFVEGNTSIATHRTENLFQQLESSSLTEEQQKIIDQRVALQRKMFEQYEKRERQRKVAELQEVMPGLTAEEAEKALEFCDGREDDAASQLVSEPGFLCQVQAAAACAPAAAGGATDAAEGAVSNKEGRSSRPASRPRPAGPRPKLIDPSTLGSSVFVGAFRGKGYNGGAKAAPRPAPRGGKKLAAVSSDQEGDAGEEGGSAPSAGAGSGEEGDLVAAGCASHVDIPAEDVSMEGEEEQKPAAGGDAEGEAEAAPQVARKPRSRRGAAAGAAQRAKRAAAGRAAKADAGSVEWVASEEAAEGVQKGQVGEEGVAPGEGGAEQQGVQEQGLCVTEDSKPTSDAVSKGEEGAGTPAATQGQQACTPLTIPRRYALAVETSDGGFRPATESEIRVLSEGDPPPDAAAQPTPTSGDQAPQAAAAAGPPLAAVEPTKAAAAATAQQAALAKTALLLSKLPVDKAVAWLLRMVEDVRCGSLDALQALQPATAAALRARLGPQQQGAQPGLEEAPSNDSASTVAVSLAAGPAVPAQPGVCVPGAEEAGEALAQAGSRGNAEAADVAMAEPAQEVVVVPRKKGKDGEGGNLEGCSPEVKKEGGADEGSEPVKMEEAVAAAGRQPPRRARAAKKVLEGELDSDAEASAGAEEDSEEEEDFSEEDADEEEEGGSSSSDDDDFQAPARRPVRRAAPAPAPSRPPSQRAPRAAKAAASALFRRAASLSDSEEDMDSEGDASDASDSEAEVVVRPRRTAASRRGGAGRGTAPSAAATPARRKRPAAAAAVAAEGGEGSEEHAAGSDVEKGPAHQPAPAAPSARKGRGAANNRKATAVAVAQEAAAEDEAQHAHQASGAGPAGPAPRRRAPPPKKQKTAEPGGEGGPSCPGPATDVAAAAPSAAAEGDDEPSSMEVEAAAQGEGADEGACPTEEEAGAGPAAEAEAGSGSAQEEDGAEAEQAKRAVRTSAISGRGHTCRGRVKQKSHKSADLVETGTLRADANWHNAGYIFPDGFVSRTLFRSSVALDQLCVHECFIIGKGGQHWPHPTFKVVALDRPEEPLIAKSCTGCWTGVLKRINAEIEARRRQGEDLPPPPKTAIAGPEYFGLNQPNIQEAIEALDPGRECSQYWAGKDQRERAAAGLPVSSAAAGARPPRAPRSSAPSASKRGGRGRKRRADSESEDDGGEEGDEDETAYMTNRWSSVSRNERYKKRVEAEGGDVSALDEDNPLPDLLDPITLEPVVRPAISPYGHVMGMATWKAVLAESSSCPFTKQPLQWEQCKMLTQSNFHLYKDKIIR